MPSGSSHSSLKYFQLTGLTKCHHMAQYWIVLMVVAVHSDVSDVIRMSNVFLAQLKKTQLSQVSLLQQSGINVSSLESLKVVVVVDPLRNFAFTSRPEKTKHGTTLQPSQTLL